MRHLTKQLATACFVLLLSACASVSKVPGSSYSQAARSHLYDMQEWRLEGRLAITAPNDSWSAHIEWSHIPDLEKIRLSGPLGQGAVVIELAGDVVTIDRGGGRVQSSNQPEQFINQQLGMFVPLKSLRFWAVGLPESGQAYQETADGFVQARWLIAYKEMQKTGVEVMPHKMAVTNGHVKLKLIIDQWDLNGGKLN
ncbi:lipoprotein insertase outer membrane protein LolB [Methyloglobulus sp.]|uniref:lipoprotein insertase outer membrane protein LolB n=1 Tax=Methyloglobulus sp. TaxID=2518622 RepID=UPI003989AB7E